VRAHVIQILRAELGPVDRQILQLALPEETEIEELRLGSRGQAPGVLFDLGRGEMAGVRQVFVEADEPLAAAPGRQRHVPRDLVIHVSAKSERAEQSVRFPHQRD
jgi:hypothetical protein